MVLDIKSNQDMIESIWEDVYRLYANIALFNIRDLSIYGVLFLWRGPRANSSWVLEPIPHILKEPSF